MLAPIRAENAKTWGADNGAWRCPSKHPPDRVPPQVPIGPPRGAERACARPEPLRLAGLPRRAPFGLLAPCWRAPGGARMWPCPRPPRSRRPRSPCGSGRRVRLPADARPWPCLQIGEACCRYGASVLANGADPDEARSAAVECAAELSMIAETLRRLSRLSGPERRQRAVHARGVGLVAASGGGAARRVRPGGAEVPDRPVIRPRSRLRDSNADWRRRSSRPGEPVTVAEDNELPSFGAACSAGPGTS